MPEPNLFRVPYHYAEYLCEKDGELPKSSVQLLDPTNGRVYHFKVRGENYFELIPEHEDILNDFHGV